ncbi:MAG TPA: hypothetical protein DIT13_17960, partial [Verrucomicrobiales bacterium]|nr:hypothetical protein [Verrucomicrobiales bacterium]
MPYQFGGFSFTSYADKRKLITTGLLVDDANQWELTAEGRKAVAGERALRERLGRFRLRHGGEGGGAPDQGGGLRHPHHPPPP